MPWMRGVGCLLGLLCAVACASEEPASESCVPGESRACAGPGQCAGFQICAPSGNEFEPCQCSDAGLGGTSGGAGAAGSAGSGGLGGTSADAGDGSAGTAGSAGTGGSDGGAGCSTVTSCWLTETIGAAQSGPVRVVIDAQGKHHALVWGTSPVYATNASGAWVTVAAPAGAKGLVVDGTGVAHVCSATASSLSRSTRTGGSWNTETVRSMGDPINAGDSFQTFAYCTLAISGSAAHIAFKAKGFGGVGNQWFHVQKTGSTWVDATAMQVHVEGVGNGELALSSTGAWHLVYREGSQSFAIGYRIDAVFQSYVVTPAPTDPNFGEASSGPGFALDTSGAPHIAYAGIHPESPNSASFVYYATGSSTALSHEQASCQADPEALREIALALSPSGPQIAWFTKSGHIQHGVKVGTDWSNEDLGAASDSPGLAIDAQGKAHVAFVDSSGNLVRMRQCP